MGLGALAFVLLAAGIALELRRDAVIRHVTSRSLGTLAPGYAATRGGMRVYAALVGSIGLTVAGLWLAGWSAFGPWLAILGIALFIVYSFVAIAGEVRTYRALTRR